jgi:hypothetical protein
VSPGLINPSVGGTPITPPVPPGDTPQYPNMRATYAHPPSYDVPGWDFYVGAFSATVRKKPGVDALPAGMGLNAPAKQIGMAAGSITTTGWDFTQDGGWQFIGFTGCDAPVFNDCSFAAGANLQPCFNMTSPSTGGITFNDCTFTGSANSQSGFDGLFNSVGQPGPITFNRCDFDKAFDDIIQLGINGGTVPITLNQCITRNNSKGPASGGPHPDHLQCTGTSIFKPVINNCLMLMNEFTEQGTQFVFLTDTGAQVQDGFITNTVMICTEDTVNPSNFFVVCNRAVCLNALQITNCYFDPRGLLTPSICFNFGISGGVVPVVSGCINMNTGATILA